MRRSLFSSSPRVGPAVPFIVFLVGLIPSFAVAQEQELRERMASLAEDQHAKGRLVFQEVHVGPITVGAPYVVTLDLEPGVAYEWQALCSDACGDLDMRVVDGWGDPVASDEELDPMPRVTYTTASGGPHSLEIEIIRCSDSPCLMAVAGWTPDPDRVGDLNLSTGSLEPGDPQRGNGAFYEEFLLSAEVGQILVAEMEARDFDSYLVVTSPSGRNTENDDYLGSTDQSRVEIRVDETGDWRVLATSFGAKERGAYTLGTGVFGEAEPKGGAKESAALLQVSGQLEESDPILPTGERVDLFEFRAQAGTQVVVDLNSSDFDPYLIVEGPEGKVGENDDFGGEGDHASVAFQVATTGAYRVGVTSFEPGIFGAYNLVAREGESLLFDGRSEAGTLDTSDEVDPDGRFLDIYTIEVRAGERLTAHLASRDFDTFLRVEGPGGLREENDDAGSMSESEITVSAGEPGVYRIIATSFGAGETGAYSLRFSTIPDPDAEERAAAPTLAIGEWARGRLDDRDGTRPSGEPRDFYTVRIPGGRRVAIEMRSVGFDGYLRIEGPNGFQAENDDWRGDLNRSRIEFSAEGTGDYLVTVSSLNVDGRGAYEIGAEALTVAPIRKGTP